jgi:hypothetical protein
MLSENAVEREFLSTPDGRARLLSPRKPRSLSIPGSLARRSG